MKNKLKSIYSIFLIIALLFPFIGNHLNLNSFNNIDSNKKKSLDKKTKEININNIISEINDYYKDKKLSISVKKSSDKKNNFSVNNNEFVVGVIALMYFSMMIWMTFFSDEETWNKWLCYICVNHPNFFVLKSINYLKAKGINFHNYNCGNC